MFLPRGCDMLCRICIPRIQPCKQSATYCRSWLYGSQPAIWAMSWASQGAARAVDWLRPAQHYVPGACMWLLETMIMQQPTNGKPALLVREVRPIQLPEKKKNKGRGFPCVSTCGSGTRHKLQIENSQNRAGHRSNTTCLTHTGRFLVISWWVTNWAAELKFHLGR